MSRRRKVLHCSKHSAHPYRTLHSVLNPPLRDSETMPPAGNNRGQRSNTEEGHLSDLEKCISDKQRTPYMSSLHILGGFVYVKEVGVCSREQNQIGFMEVKMDSRLKDHLVQGDTQCSSHIPAANNWL